MCGIAGIFGYQNDALPIDVDELIDIREAMAVRGPDGRGLWIGNDRRIGLAHRTQSSPATASRISIESRARPMGEASQSFFAALSHFCFISS